MSEVGESPTGPEGRVVILIDKLASDRHGRPCWFKAMHGLGPMNTWDREQAMEFTSREAAVGSLAYAHPMRFYEPRETTSVHA